tara:strand:- start:176 stop:415 length:240 start_codon:yes stop_codon:yes gene_type:complete
MDNRTQTMKDRVRRQELENSKNNYDGLLWCKETIEQMSWDEIRELMNERIKNGSWKTYLETLGKPPHLIKHDYLLRKIK